MFIGVAAFLLANGVWGAEGVWREEKEVFKQEVLERVIVFFVARGWTWMGFGVFFEFF